MVAAYRSTARRSARPTSSSGQRKSFWRPRCQLLSGDGRPVRVTDWRVFLPMAAALALSACAGGLTTGTSPAVSAAPASGPQRDLTPEEKKAIMDAVAPSLRDPASAKYRWAKFPAVTVESSVSYCATVDAKSPYAAYDGRQAYIVEAKLSGGKVSSAIMGLITGGKDVALVAKMCAKYGLDPNKAS